MSKKNKTIKEQVAELEEITAWFSGDDFDVEQAVQKYETAKALLKNITQQLESLKNQITKL
ncbi:MAG: exodeoxyribonuclease VII small subunit [Candidatus Nanosyncoccaceae bacterium]|jgi:exodeoxyribonuclease VII small subunit